MHMLALAHDREFHFSSDEREKGMILAHADTLTRVKFRSTLPHENVARYDRLAAEALDAKTLSVGISAIARGAAALFRGKKLKIKSKHARAVYQFFKVGASKFVPGVRLLRNDHAGRLYTAFRSFITAVRMT